MMLRSRIARLEEERTPPQPQRLLTVMCEPGESPEAAVARLALPPGQHHVVGHRYGGVSRNLPKPTSGEGEDDAV